MSKFLKYDETEFHMFLAEDERDEERIVFGFGNTCPLQLDEDVKVCKSVVPEKDLAKHACDSYNHPRTLNDKELAFEVANSVPLEETLESPSSREWCRCNAAKFANKDKTTEKAAVAVAPKKRARSVREASRGASSGSPTRSSDYDGQQRSDDQLHVLKSGSKYARISVSELAALGSVLSRSIESQKPAIESLTFYNRQIENERKVFQEAHMCIQDLIFKARLRQ